MTGQVAFDVVVAMDEDRGIGVGGDLPWRLPGDMAHFKRLTQTTTDAGRTNAVLMGRKTWASIPDRFRPLVGRHNMVLSRRRDLVVPAGVAVAGSFDAALAMFAAGRAAGQLETLFVIGGGAVYAEALERGECRYLYATRVHGRFECDTVFPDMQPGFVRAEVLSTGRDGDIGYDIERWQRRI